MLFTFTLILTAINLAISVCIYHFYNDDKIPNLDPYTDLNMHDLDETSLDFRTKLYRVNKQLEEVGK